MISSTESILRYMQTCDTFRNFIQMVTRLMINASASAKMICRNKSSGLLHITRVLYHRDVNISTNQTWPMTTSQ